MSCPCRSSNEEISLCDNWLVETTVTIPYVPEKITIGISASITFKV